MLSSYIVSEKIIKDTSFYEVSFLFMPSKVMHLSAFFYYYYPIFLY